MKSLTHEKIYLTWQNKHEKNGWDYSHWVYHTQGILFQFFSTLYISIHVPWMCFNNWLNTDSVKKSCLHQLRSQRVVFDMFVVPCSIQGVGAALTGACGINEDCFMHVVDYYVWLQTMFSDGLFLFKIFHQPMMVSCILLAMSLCWFVIWTICILQWLMMCVNVSSFFLALFCMALFFGHLFLLWRKELSLAGCTAQDFGCPI